jgi:hypothetical protein
MAESTLVEILKRDGQKLVRDLLRKKVPLAAAWWLKDIPENRQFVGEWHFYVASSVVDEEGPEPVYQQILDSFDSFPDGRAMVARISLGRIKAVGLVDPVYADVSKLIERFGKKAPIISGHCQLGRIEAEEVHIVYVPTSAASETRRSPKRARK